MTKRWQVECVYTCSFEIEAEDEDEAEALAMSLAYNQGGGGFTAPQDAENFTDQDDTRVELMQ